MYVVPEAYRQRFHDAKCQDNQSYMEFAHEKETLFDKWCTLQQVGNNYGKLRQLVLLQEVCTYTYQNLPGRAEGP